MNRYSAHEKEIPIPLDDISLQDIEKDIEDLRSYANRLGPSDDEGTEDLDFTKTSRAKTQPQYQLQKKDLDQASDESKVLVDFSKARNQIEDLKQNLIQDYMRNTGDLYKGSLFRKNPLKTNRKNRKGKQTSKLPRNKATFEDPEEVTDKKVAFYLKASKPFEPDTKSEFSPQGVKHFSAQQQRKTARADPLKPNKGSNKKTNSEDETELEPGAVKGQKEAESFVDDEMTNSARDDLYGKSQSKDSAEQQELESLASINQAIGGTAGHISGDSRTSDRVVNKDHAVGNSFNVESNGASDTIEQLLNPNQRTVNSAEHFIEHAETSRHSNKGRKDDVGSADSFDKAGNGLNTRHTNRLRNRKKFGPFTVEEKEARDNWQNKFSAVEGKGADITAAAIQKRRGSWSRRQYHKPRPPPRPRPPPPPPRPPPPPPTTTTTKGPLTTSEDSLKNQMIKWADQSHMNKSVQVFVDSGSDSVNIPLSGTESSWTTLIHGECFSMQGTVRLFDGGTCHPQGGLRRLSSEDSYVGNRGVVIAGAVMGGVGLLIIILSLVYIVINKRRSLAKLTVKKSKTYQRVPSSEGKAGAAEPQHSLFPSSSEETSTTEESDQDTAKAKVQGQKPAH